MLYDRRWDKSADVMSKKDFMSWLREQDPDQTYEAYNSGWCAVALYTQARGRKITKSSAQARLLGMDLCRFMHVVVYPEPNTYGALLGRLEFE